MLTTQQKHNYYQQQYPPQQTRLDIQCHTEILQYREKHKYRYQRQSLFESLLTVGKQQQ